MTQLTAQLDLPPGVHAPAVARRRLTGVLLGWGFRDEVWLEQAALIVSELVTNAVRHGGGCLSLAAEAHDTRVLLSVADGSSVAPRQRTPDDNGGRGLPVIEALSAQWGVREHQGGKQVWVELAPYRGWLSPHREVRLSA
ncbi:ATP-binding protein [Micromonospora sp. NPDC004551]|uniref:ATP-binding protein n=1 Tax=Micromonospora sp. NPDC004551 TaxID=3154284 RepID=UPI0033B8320B